MFSLKVFKNDDGYVLREAIQASARNSFSGRRTQVRYILYVSPHRLSYKAGARVIRRKDRALTLIIRFDDMDELHRQGVFDLWEPLKIHRTKNRRNLFRHTSQKTFAEDKLCARIFVASDEKSSRRSPHVEYLEAPRELRVNGGREDADRVTLYLPIDRFHTAS